MKIHIEKPSFRQRLVVIKYNLLFWLAPLVFKGEELKKEQIDLVKEAFKEAKDHE